MGYQIARATPKELKKISDEMELIAEEITQKTKKRMEQFEKEAKQYARQKTLEDHPILRWFFK